MVAKEFFSRQFRILISDDDEACRRTVDEILIRQGYETRVASCGQEAIFLAKKSLVHLLIVDMNMPDMTGLDAVTVIHREVSASVPGILMSADHFSEMMKLELSAEFESFLEKPFGIESLQRSVEQLIHRHYIDG